MPSVASLARLLSCLQQLQLRLLLLLRLPPSTSASGAPSQASPSFAVSSELAASVFVVPGRVASSAASSSQREKAQFGPTSIQSGFGLGQNFLHMTVRLWMQCLSSPPHRVGNEKRHTFGRPDEHDKSFVACWVFQGVFFLRPTALTTREGTLSKI